MKGVGTGRDKKRGKGTCKLIQNAVSEQKNRWLSKSSMKRMKDDVADRNEKEKLNRRRMKN